MFLSPKSFQSTRDFNAHNSSSWLRIEAYSSESSCSRERTKAEGWIARVFWRPANQARSFFFRAKIFPKISLFQVIARLLKVVMAKFRLGVRPQAFSTTWWNPGWLSHIFSKRKGLSNLLWRFSYKLRRRGQWSKLTLGKCVTLASGKAKFQGGFPQHLSILWWIKASTSLRLVQVKAALE